jgi:hypothetical protein
LFRFIDRSMFRPAVRLDKAPGAAGDLFYRSISGNNGREPLYGKAFRWPAVSIGGLDGTTTAQRLRRCRWRQVGPTSASLFRWSVTPPAT